MTLIFQSISMQRVVERARLYAQAPATILITGESGTGKELLARMIHRKGGQARPYVRVNCAALSETLIESELFGHEAGAFTDASGQRQGRFEAVADGDLFLDEIGELPPRVQAKLLRVLEEREFQRVGGNETLHFRGRLLAATNRDLRAEVAAGRFRADLFHRLDVLTLQIPPLRDRREDIPTLTPHFLKQHQAELRRPFKGVSRAVMQALCEHEWPGNVRELRNVLLRGCVLAPGELIEHVDLQSTPTVPLRPGLSHVDASPPPTFPPALEHADCVTEIPASELLQLPLDVIERQVILARIARFRGNKTEAAAALGVTPRTLRNKLSQYRKLGYAG